MKEQFNKYKKYLPLAILIVFILFRPTFNGSTLPETHKSLAEQYAQHVGANTKPIHGIDVSYDQGEIDWAKIMQTDVGFVYLKATDGMTYTDPTFHQHMAILSKQTTLLYGAYHFFEAEDDPEKQAENFIQQVSAYSPHLSPMVDVEVTKDQDPVEIRKRLKIFSDKVQAATGCLPIIYSYRSFWDLDIGPNFDQHVFWLADYAQKMDAPAKVKKLTLWQYSEKGRVNGISGPVDLDVIMTGEDGLTAIRCTKNKHLRGEDIG
ncbi:glycoside hydrolase family 25 protein [Marinomonas transparens]|uniref:Glycoside hydrolase family 25 protein n=1 Tax=Marinomonas transparens TaxID=2795388 RepID=A0A934JQC2_9GAMM|nr:glycoside hydrolase family 25 protein [Marinomonas transparens]MBJ7536462.1 glycoside hydrolase family 25 protein [Marinomonas transparens]